MSLVLCLRPIDEPSRTTDFANIASISSGVRRSVALSFCKLGSNCTALLVPTRIAARSSVALSFSKLATLVKKNWCSQGESNPCFSLERAAS